MKIIRSIDVSGLLENLIIPNSDQILESQRVFHGRGQAFKNLNHITIDWLYPLLLITLFEPVHESELKELANEIKIRFKECSSIQVQHRYNKEWKIDCIVGKPLKNLDIIENDLKYRLEIKSGANTGLFLDMKNGRKWITNNCKNKSILNLFSYTCGFSVAAYAGGAKSVFNIDMSSSFLKTGRENHRINNHDLSSIRFEKLNIFKSFGRIDRQGPYDLIICDPPTFQKGSIDLARDYPKLIRRLKNSINPNGILFLCINSPNIGGLTGRNFLIQTIEEETNDFTLVEEVKPPKAFVEVESKGTQILIYKKKETL